VGISASLLYWGQAIFTVPFATFAMLPLVFLLANGKPSIRIAQLTVRAGVGDERPPLAA
jgi:hypothetical protein